MAAPVRVCISEIEAALQHDLLVGDVTVRLENGTVIHFRAPDDAEQAIKHSRKLHGLKLRRGTRH